MSVCWEAQYFSVATMLKDFQYVSEKVCTAIHIINMHGAT